MTEILKKGVSASNSKYQVYLSYAGEGYNGDFNEKDPEDTPLLRCDILTKCEDDKRRWNDEAAESACTGISAYKTVKEVKALAKMLLEKVTVLAEEDKGGWDYILSTAVADFE